MDHIETAILNCYGIREAEQNMVFAARLTQHGHTIQNMADLMELYHQSYSQKTVENIAGLPHPTVQKFMVITVAVVGASRRFLAQITRHQNEVKYMSASLQYSNYSGHAAFAIPYGIMRADKEIQDIYKKSCQRGSCMEKQMSCQNPISKLWMPSDILKADYPLLIRKEVSSHED